MFQRNCSETINKQSDTSELSHNLIVNAFVVNMKADSTGRKEEQDPRKSVIHFEEWNLLSHDIKDKK